MVMKDKLYKTHHKGLYYKTRKALIASAIVLSVFTAVSVPTYINVKKSIEAEKRALRNTAVAEPVEVDVKLSVRQEDKAVKRISKNNVSDDEPTYKFERRK